MQFRFCSSNKISITQTTQNHVQRILQVFYKFIYSRSVVVEELTFAIFQLVLLITHVLLDLCAVFLSPERKTLLVLQLNAVGESSLMKWVKVILD